MSLKTGPAVEVGETFIYTLSDPRNGKIRYVGKTNDPRSRLKSHLKDKSRTAKSWWIGSLIRNGFVPMLTIIAKVPFPEWKSAEQKWISYLKASGFDLLNGDNGGLGTGRITEEVRAKISRRLTGAKSPKLWKKCQSYSLAGELIQSFVSVDEASKMTGTNRPNISRSIRSGKQSGGFLWKHCQGERPPSKIDTPYINGRIPLSEESKGRLLDRLRHMRGWGPPFSDETKAKMRAGRLGKSPPNKGISMSDSQRKLLRSVCQSKKPIVQFTTDGTKIKEWPSIKQASQETEATRCGIARCCRGGQRHAAGFMWKYRSPVTITVEGAAEGDPTFVKSSSGIGGG